MRVTRNFKCTNEECGEVLSRLLDSEITEVECKLCGSKSTRLLSTPRVQGNTTGKSPSYSKFSY